MIPVYSIFREDGFPLNKTENFNLIISALGSVGYNNYVMNNNESVLSLYVDNENVYNAISAIEDALELLSLQNTNVRFVVLLEDVNLEYRVFENGSEINNTYINIKEDSPERDELLPKLFNFKSLKLFPNLFDRIPPKRLIIDDSFILDSTDVPITIFEYQYDTVVDRAVHAFENKFYAACTEMYRFLHKEHILQDIAFEYEEEILPDGHIKVYFALDSNDLEYYDMDMVDSGVQYAELITEYLTGKKVYPKSQISFASMFTTSMLERNREKVVTSSWGITTCHETIFSHLDTNEMYECLRNAKHSLECDDEEEYISHIKKAISVIYERHKKGVVIELSENLIRDSKRTKGMKSVSIPLKESETKWSYLEIEPEKIFQNRFYFDKSKKLVSLGKSDSIHKLSLKKNNKFVTKEVTSDELCQIVMDGKIEYAKEMNEKRQKEWNEKHNVSSGNTLAAIPF